MFVLSRLFFTNCLMTVFYCHIPYSCYMPSFRTVFNIVTDSEYVQITKYSISFSIHLLGMRNITVTVPLRI